MNDLISKSQLLKEINDNCLETQDVRFVKHLINEAPIEDKRETGEWKACRAEFINTNFYRCSQCGMDSKTETRFCHYCGADMRGE